MFDTSQISKFWGITNWEVRFRKYVEAFIQNYRFELSFTIRDHHTVQKTNITIGVISGVHWGLKERWL